MEPNEDKTTTSKSRLTKQDDKFLVALRVTSCFKEGVHTDDAVEEHEIIRFREEIQKYIEAALLRLGDVSIVEDDIKDAWSHFILIVFDIVYLERGPAVDISVCYFEASKGFVGSEEPFIRPSLYELREFCKTIVENFERQFLAPAREKVSHEIKTDKT